MWDQVQDRILKEARYIIESNATVRKTATYFNVSKSTVHKDVVERLKEMDNVLYAEVRLVLDKNLAERHIRGGIAMRNKYRKQKSC